MARSAKPKRPKAEPLVISEHGLGLRYDRGEVEVESRAADPDDPNRSISRPRRHDPVRLLWQRGRLTEAHWAATERFRTDHELAEGAREDQLGGTAPWQRCYTMRLLDAIAARREAIQAVGMRLSAVFVGAVIEQEPLRDLDRRLRIRSGTAEDLLREALERLANHYAEVDRHGRNKVA